MHCFLIPHAFRLLPHLLMCVVCLMLLPACKISQTSKQPAFLVQFVKKGVLDKTVKTLFGDSAKFDKDHVEFSKDFSLEFIKSKVITNEEIRDFLSPKGGLIAYTENFESWVKWERTPDNKVRVSVFYKETPKTDKQGYLPTHHQPTNFMTTTAPPTTSQIVEQHREACRQRGYAFFEKGNYNVNMHAIRKDSIFDNGFTDEVRIIYKEKNTWKVYQSKWTTLAGTKGFGGEQAPLTGVQTGTGVSGVAIIAPSQYRRVFKFVDNYWQWLAYPYFAQIGNMSYWRDNNKNGVIDKGMLYVGNYATNLHRMGNNGQEKDWVNSESEWWSQGCNGASEPQFRQILPIMREAVKIHGDVFSYTMFDKEQLPNI